MRLLLREEEIETQRLGAEHPLRIENPHVDPHEVAALLRDAGPQQDVIVGRMDGPEIAHLHLRRHAARLELAENDPAADLVGQRRLNPAVQRVDPALKLRTRPPAAHDLVALLVKLHAKALRAVRVAAETAVALQPAPWIDDLLHVG